MLLSDDPRFLSHFREILRCGALLRYMEVCQWDALLQRIMDEDGSVQILPHGFEFWREPYSTSALGL